MYGSEIPPVHVPHFSLLFYIHSFLTCSAFHPNDSLCFPVGFYTFPLAVCVSLSSLMPSYISSLACYWCSICYGVLPSFCKIFFIITPLLVYYLSLLSIDEVNTGIDTQVSRLLSRRLACLRRECPGQASSRVSGSICPATSLLIALCFGFCDYNCVSRPCSERGLVGGIIMVVINGWLLSPRSATVTRTRAASLLNGSVDF